MEHALPAGETERRIARLQEQLRAGGHAGMLVSQNTDLYYLTGTMQSGYLFVPGEGEPVLYVRRSVARAEREARVRTKPLGSFRAFGAELASDFPRLAEAAGRKTVLTPLDALPAQIYLRLAEVFGGLGAELADGSAVMRRLRMHKSPYEIGRIQAAARAAAEALDEALPLLREGVTELEWMAAFEHAIRKRGHIGTMRMRAYNLEVLTGMVGAGDAAAEPSAFDGPAGGRGLGPAAAQSVSRRPFGRNEPILIDIGCCIDGYIIDQTRTAVIGDLPDDLLAAYETSVRIMRRAEELLVPGVPAERLYEEALRMADEAGLADHFMGFGADRVRFLGHGIGLEVDEWPVLAKGFDMPLEPGMVLAVEPKFTFPGRGVVGIENSYAVRSDGPPQALTLTPERLIRLP
jgi:Xaa-Pro aminopeptidase